MLKHLNNTMKMKKRTERKEIRTMLNGIIIAETAFFVKKKMKISPKNSPKTNNSKNGIKFSKNTLTKP